MGCMNASTTVSTILKHLIPALESIKRDIQETESRQDSLKETSQPPKREQAAKEAEDSTKKLLTLADAATYLSFSQSYLYRLTSRKQISHYKIGSRILFSEQQLVNWLAGFESPAGITTPRRRTRLSPD